MHVCEFHTKGALTLKAFADNTSVVLGTVSSSCSDDQWTEQAALRNAGHAARWFGLFSANCDVLLPVGDKVLQPAESSTTDAKCSRTSIDKDAVVYRVECGRNI